MRLIAMLLVVCVSVSACGNSAMLNAGTLAGTALGAAGGMGLGAAIGEGQGKELTGALIGTGAGAALGMLSGISYHRELAAAQRSVVIREAEEVSEVQRKIDSAREDIYDQSSWGSNETKPWNERYWGEAPNVYQGPVSPTYRP